MKRIARQARNARNIQPALEGYRTLIRVLRQYLPPSTAALFAEPRPVEGDVVEWYADLGGQPVPFAELDRSTAEGVRQQLESRLQAIRALAERLEQQGETGQAELLRQAAEYPDTSTLYVLNGQPVVTFWGGGQAPESSPLAPPPPAPPLPPEPVSARRRWWPWLLLLLLLLALLAALWWWWRQQAVEPPAEEPTPPAAEQPRPEEPPLEPWVPEEPPATPEPEPEPKLPEVEPEPEVQPEPVPEPEPEVVKPEPAPVVVPPKPEPEPKPEPKPVPKPEPKPDPVAALRQRIQAAGSRCDQLQKLQTSEPLLKQHPELRTQIDQQLSRHCREQRILNAKNLCPSERPKELAPELGIVFDASGSMDISLLATTDDLRQAELVQGATNLALGLLLGGNPGINTSRMGNLYREPKRITAAKQATTAVVQGLPSDVNAGLVLVADCPRSRKIGFYSPAQRGSLLSRVNNIVPQGGTPLADGIAKAGEMLDGVNRESVMLVVSDGDESCGMDPCAVARDLARRKPHLKINVVDILGTGAGNCLARATGGQVFTARNAGDLNLMTRQAARDVLPPAHCR